MSCRYRNLWALPIYGWTFNAKYHQIFCYNECSFSNSNSISHRLSYLFSSNLKTKFQYPNICHHASQISDWKSGHLQLLVDIFYKVWNQSHKELWFDLDMTWFSLFCCCVTRSPIDEGFPTFSRWISTIWSFTIDDVLTARNHSTEMYHCTSRDALTNKTCWFRLRIIWPLGYSVYLITVSLSKNSNFQHVHWRGDSSCYKRPTKTSNITAFPSV